MYFSDTLIHNAGQVYLTYLSQLAIFFLISSVKIFLGTHFLL